MGVNIEDLKSIKYRIDSILVENNMLKDENDKLFAENREYIGLTEKLEGEVQEMGNSLLNEYIALQEDNTKLLAENKELLVIQVGPGVACQSVKEKRD